MAAVFVTVGSVQVYPLDDINQSIIWKMNRIVLTATSVEFKFAFLHA